MRVAPRGPRCAARWGLAAALCFGASAVAANPTARLDYQVGPGAEACPDQVAIQNAVAGRLGYFPFEEGAELLVVANVSRTPAGLAARLELKHPSGALKGGRDLSSTGTDCVELAAAMELAISIAIDPLSLSRPVHPIAPKGPPAQPTPSAELATAAASAPGAPTGPRPRADIGLLGSWGEVGHVAVSGSISGGLQWDQLSLSLEVRGDLPTSRSEGGGSISTALLAGAVVSCIHFAGEKVSFEGCALVAAGALYVAGRDMIGARQLWDPFIALGARVGVSYPIGRNLWVGLGVDLLVPLDRTVVNVNGQLAWQTPDVLPAAGLHLSGSL